MLREFEFFHGIVFARILHSSARKVSIERFSDDFNAGYILNGNTGIYIKHCNKRLTPWPFSFQPEHLDQIVKLKESFGYFFLVLVCNDDGVVCLNYGELVKILGEQCDSAKWIRVARRRREMYSVGGSDGELEFKIGASDFPAKLFVDAAEAQAPAI